MESFRSNCRESSPRGPLTATSPSSILTSTPGGNVIGALPTLDILALSHFKLVLDRRGFSAPLRPWKGPAILLPDITENLAAHLPPPCLLPGHDAKGRGQYGDAQASIDPRNLGLLHVDSQSGLADPLQAMQEGLLTANVAKLDPQVA